MNVVVRSVLLLLLAGGIVAASPTDGSLLSSRQSVIGDGWSGTASAVCECADDRCITVSCSVSGEASYQSAKKALEAKIKARVKSEGGRLKGEISFEIRFDQSESRERAMLPQEIARGRVVAEEFDMDEGETLEWSSTYIRKVHVCNGGPGVLRVVVTDQEGQVVMSRTIGAGSQMTWKPSPSRRLRHVRVTAKKDRVKTYVHIERS